MPETLVSAAFWCGWLVWMSTVARNGLALWTDRSWPDREVADFVTASLFALALIWGLMPTTGALAA